MRIIVFIQLITLVNPVLSDVISKNLEAYLRVGEYLRTHRQLPTSRGYINRLENSNNIGIGYDPLHGSPVCYTTSCQADGFRAPIFDLNYVRTSEGGCTTKLIPEYVTMHCLPGSERTTDTQVIDTLDRLKQVTESGFEINAGGKHKLLSASYKYSKDIRYMVDKIAQENSEVLFTTLKISTAKLSMLELRMNLTGDFRYVIENLPCCDYDEVVEKYINDHIFGYYGYSYVTTLVLGGVAQQSIAISSLNATTLAENGIDKKHEADIKFYASFGMKPSSNQNNNTQEMFMHYAGRSYNTLLGGDPSVNNLDDWIKTVKENPVIIKFNIKYIFDILTQAENRFPNDPNIKNKSRMIERALDNYTEASAFCYGDNCSGHGSCHDTGYFQFGVCQCQSGWSGLDCSKNVPEKPRPLVLSGTLACMRNDDDMCIDSSPSYYYCPWMWVWSAWDFCSKLYTNDQPGPASTICGYRVRNFTILCDGRNPYSDPCPDGYKRHEQNLETFCYKTDSTRDDLQGTMCGIEVKVYTEWKLESSFWSTDSEVPCDGYYPGRGSCPPGYALQIGFSKTVVPCGFKDWGRCDRTYKFSFCFKK